MRGMGLEEFAFTIYGLSMAHQINVAFEAVSFEDAYLDYFINNYP